MKKILVLLLAAAPLCAGALADGVTWEDRQQELAASGLTGRFVSLPGTGAEMWLPDGMKELEMEEFERDIYVARFYDDAGSEAYDVQYAQIRFEDYDASVRESGFEPELLTVNGLDALRIPMPDMLCAFAVYALPEDHVLVVIYSPMPEEIPAAWDIVTSSVRA